MKVLTTSVFILVLTFFFNISYGESNPNVSLISLPSESLYTMVEGNNIYLYGPNCDLLRQKAYSLKWFAGHGGRENVSNSKLNKMSQIASIECSEVFIEKLNSSLNTPLKSWKMNITELLNPKLSLPFLRPLNIIGPNCWNAVGYFLDFIPSVRNTEAPEFEQILKNNLCIELTDKKKIRSGDIGSLMYQQGSNRVHQHSFVFIDGDFVLQKEGPHKRSPYQAVSLKEAILVYKPALGYMSVSTIIERISVFRCQSNKLKNQRPKESLEKVYIERRVDQLDNKLNSFHQLNRINLQELLDYLIELENIKNKIKNLKKNNVFFKKDCEYYNGKLDSIKFTLLESVQNYQIHAFSKFEDKDIIGYGLELDIFDTEIILDFTGENGVNEYFQSNQLVIEKSYLLKRS